MTTAPDCPFCLQNDLLTGPIIGEHADSFMIEAAGSEGCYLIIPREHVELPQELPADWWGGVRELLQEVPGLGSDYNLSMNIGTLAGQSVKHVHLWVMPRFEGRADSGQGLAALIDKANRE